MIVFGDFRVLIQLFAGSISLFFNSNQTKSAIPIFLTPYNFQHYYLARIQLLKEVSHTKFQTFPLQLSGYHDLPSLSFVLHSYQRQYVGWVLISARSVEKCTSVERLAT